MKLKQGKARVVLVLLSLLTVSSGLFGAIPTQKVQAAAGEVNVTDSNILWSPYSWVFSGSTYAQTPTTGSYLKVAFTGSTLALDIDTSMLASIAPNVAPANVGVAAYIDGSATPVRRTLANISGGELVFRNDLAAGNHYAQIYLTNTPVSARRWGTTGPDTPPTALLRITAIQLATDGSILPLTGTPLAKKTPKLIFYGDSITEGNNIGGTYAELSYAANLGRSLNAEYSERGYASLAWTASFFSGTPSFYVADPALGVWSNAYRGQSLLNGGLVSGGYIDGVPDAVFNNLGINDYSSRASGFNSSAGMKAAIKSWLVDQRTAIGPRPAIFMIVPFSFGNTGGTDIAEYKNAWLTAVTEYQTEHPTDKRVYTFDLGTEAYNTLMANTSDNTHPNPTGSALLANLINTQVGSIGTKIILDQPLAATLNGGAITQGMTIDAKPTFTGTAPAGSTVTVTVNSDPVTCTAVADTSGNWTCTFSTAVPAGAHSLAISANTVYGTSLQLASVGVNVLNSTFTATSTDDNLADTGSSTLIPMLMAGVFILASGAIVVAIKRSRT